MSETEKYEFLEEFGKAMRAALAQPPEEPATTRYFAMAYDVTQRGFNKLLEKTDATTPLIFPDPQPVEDFQS